MESTNSSESLNAELNRFTLSRHDFEEAHSYLKAFDVTMPETIQRALLSAAIVAYSRPFKRGSNNTKASKLIALPEALFDAPRRLLHARIVELRDKGIAHSDYELKPTSRVQAESPGLLTWSKPFNPLSEGIDIQMFAGMAWHLHLHCFNEASRVNNQLNGTAPIEVEHAAVPHGAEIRLTVPLSAFGPAPEVKKG